MINPLKKKAKRTYKIVRVLYIIILCFIFIWGMLGTVSNFQDGNYKNAFTALSISMIMALMGTFIFRFVKNLVVEVTFNGKNTIIETYSSKYVLCSENFVKVQHRSFSRLTLITYVDKKKKRVFVFQEIRWFFKKYSLDMNEMKKHMPFALFDYK